MPKPSIFYWEDIVKSLLVIGQTTRSILEDILKALVLILKPSNSTLAGSLINLVLQGNWGFKNIIYLRPPRLPILC